MNIETKLKRQQATIKRRQASLESALAERDQLIKLVLGAGIMNGNDLARLTGVSRGRISQIRQRIEPPSGDCDGGHCYCDDEKDCTYGL
jgi:hypothetical protein